MVYNFLQHILAGAVIQYDQLVTNGGLVFGVAAQGADIAEA